MSVATSQVRDVGPPPIPCVTRATTRRDAIQEHFAAPVRYKSHKQTVTPVTDSVPDPRDNQSFGLRPIAVVVDRVGKCHQVGKMPQLFDNLEPRNGTP